MILRELAAKYDLKFDNRGFKKADQTIDSTLKKVKELGAVMAGGLAVRAIWGLVDGVRALGDELDKSTASLGISRQELQEWHFAAGLGGVDANAFTMSLRKLQRGASEAADGIATYKDEFDKMGIEVRDSSGKLKNADTLLMEMADGLGRLDTDTERVATSMALLGRTGPRLLPLFREGADGIAKMRAEAHELGGVLDDETIDQSVALTDSLWRWEFAMRGVKATIVSVLLPGIDWITRKIAQTTAAFNKYIKGTDAVEHAMQLLGIAAVALGIKLLVPFLPALLVLAKLAILIGVVFLVYDDLMTLFKGGDSVIGRFIDSIFGPGSAAEAVGLLKEAGEGMALAYRQEVVPAMMAAGAAFFDMSQDFQKDMEAMSVAFSEFIADWMLGFGTIGSDLETAKSDIAKFIEDYVNGFEEIIAVIEKFIGWIEKIPGGKAITEGLKNAVTSAIPGAGPVLNILQKVIGGGEAPPAAPGVSPVVPPILQVGQGAAPAVPVGTAVGGGTMVAPTTELNLTIQTPPGATAADVARQTEGAVRRVLNEERRATINAVKQRSE